MELSAIKWFFSPAIIGHRGASATAPENTLAAFFKAKQLGLHWVEFDVMVASTGEAVVIHDDDLERTTNGRGRVIDCSYTDLKKLDAGSWFDPLFSNERIPSLQEVLQLLWRERLAANLEIKALAGHEQATVKQVLDILEENEGRLPSPLLISSFSPLVLQLLRKASSSALLGIVIDAWQEDWHALCSEIRCISVHINHEVLTPARVREIKAKEYLLLAYTVNTLDRAEELLSWGVDALFSDCPDVLVAGLKRK
ncbi:MAG: ugpQ [Gammaproteobacteria bacterium]|jgi:glycerophosphoryl diester phosphodiesterase|nr:ugpQ [Gammaproteobacteria bacterium]